MSVTPCLPVWRHQLTSYRVLLALFKHATAKPSGIAKTSNCLTAGGTTGCSTSLNSKIYVKNIKNCSERYRQAEPPKESKDTPLQVLKTSMGNLANRSKLKPIHDGCVHREKKKVGKFHSTE